MNPPPGPPILETNGLRFAYPGGIEAIADLTLQVTEGTIVGLLGVNGSGKTTLLKLLVRLLKPQAGEVRLQGSDVHRLPTGDLCRQIGMVFQNPADQVFGTTVEQDVAFGPRNLGLDAAEVAARVESSLVAVDAWELHRREVHQLSYGQQKRVALAGVLAMHPKVLLLDEPTGGLDPAAEAQMLQLLLALNRERGMTIVFSTHAVDLLPVLAHRLCVLRRGQLWQQGTPAEVFRDPESVVRAGLRMPLIAQLFHELREHDLTEEQPLPMTVEEGRRRVVQWLAEGRRTKQGDWI